MKKVRKLLAIALTAATLCTLLTACGGKDVSGTYTQTINSKTYFSAQEVKNDMPETEKRPDGSEAMVAFNRLFGMLDSRVAEDVAGTSSAAGVSDYYKVSLELSGDKYKLTKSFNVDMDYVSDQVKGMMGGEADKPTISLTFTGTYTAKDSTVTLEVPTQVDAQVSPVAGMADSYTRFGGTYMNTSETTASTDGFPGRFFNYFNILYFVESSGTSAMTVTVDKNAGTFSID